MVSVIRSVGRSRHFLRMAALAVFFSCVSWSSGAAAQEAMSEKIVLLSAGSLQEAMKELGGLFQKEGKADVAAYFGPSGKLRSEIEAGRKFDVFASASAEHTDALFAKKLLSESFVFAYNDLCVVARPELGLTGENLVDVLKKSAVRLGTSTPSSDPMGDYTWQFFHNADKVSPGTFNILNGKALKLSGTSAAMPGGKPPYEAAFDDNKADAYVMYCTNAANTKKTLPNLTVVRIPEALNVHSAYGIGSNPSSATGKKFVQFVLSPPA